MKLPVTTVFVLLSRGILAASPAAVGVPVPSAVPLPNSLRSQGCWGAKGNWTKQTPLRFPSSGSCGTACTAANFTVSALQAADCWCGDEYPPQGTSVDSSNCNYPCPGYDLEACGGLGPPPAYSVFNTGLNVDVPYRVTTSSSISTPSPTTAAQTATAAQSTPTSAVSPPASNPSSSDGGSSSPVGIVVGVIVGVIALAAIVVGLIFYRRRQRRLDDEEERKRVAAVEAFVGSGKPSSFSTSPSINDSRLDPGLAHRRMSDGSIADNQDYSRKILRVINT